jgi:hypothetical protein
MNITVKSVLELKDKIEAEKLILKNNLEQLQRLGFAKLFHWDDKYDFHATWVVSEDKNLLSEIKGIDGWSDKDDYIYQEYGKWLSKDDLRLIRIKAR